MYNAYIMVDFFMSPQGRKGAGENARLVAAKKVAEAKAAAEKSEAARIASEKKAAEEAEAARIATEKKAAEEAESARIASEISNPEDHIKLEPCE